MNTLRHQRRVPTAQSAVESDEEGFKSYRTCWYERKGQFACTPNRQAVIASGILRYKLMAWAGIWCVYYFMWLKREAWGLVGDLELKITKQSYGKRDGRVQDRVCRQCGHRERSKICLSKSILPSQWLATWRILSTGWTYWWKLSSGYPHLVIKVEIFTPAFERIFPIYDVVAVYGRLARWADDRPTSTSWFLAHHRRVRRRDK